MKTIAFFVLSFSCLLVNAKPNPIPVFNWHLIQEDHTGNKRDLIPNPDGVEIKTAVPGWSCRLMPKEVERNSESTSETHEIRCIPTVKTQKEEKPFVSTSVTCVNLTHKEHMDIGHGTLTISDGKSSARIILICKDIRLK